MELVVETAEVDPRRRALEVVERKGAGHPDSLCDAAAEAFSRRLCRAYLDACGHVLHHNVDKALLVAGRTRVRFGAGEWLDPIELTLAGRATARAGATALPLDEIGRDAAREALAAVRCLDAADPAQLRVRVAARPGAADLREVFAAAERGAPRANDTSIGVGFAPLSPAERLALEADARLAARVREQPDCALGEDTKVMLVRRGESLCLTVAAAMLAGRVPDERSYRDEVEAVRALALEAAREAGFGRCEVAVNAADEPGSVYLTASGTSAECGDDGQVGRGNRANGLITPMRPMTLEAFAGKNPRTHVGKLLSLAATRAAEACAALDGVVAAECVLVSRIGAPVSEPQAAGVRLDAEAGRAEGLRRDVEEAVARACAGIPALWRELVAGDQPRP